MYGTVFCNIYYYCCFQALREQLGSLKTSKAYLEKDLKRAEDAEQSLSRVGTGSVVYVENLSLYDYCCLFNGYC